MHSGECQRVFDFPPSRTASRGSVLYLLLEKPKNRPQEIRLPFIYYPPWASCDMTAGQYLGALLGEFHSSPQGTAGRKGNWCVKLVWLGSPHTVGWELD